MILEEIRLTDFRCFYGQEVIKFSEDPDKNVTVIYAENGLGKTTILNALLWCFYGETTARFEKKHDIVNYDAKREGRTLASVEVLFEHNENHYIAKRYSREDKGSYREFVVARIDAGGETPLQTPETFINTVIPRDMAGHFLFDGEHAEVFLAEDNRPALKAAVRDILGCTLVEEAISDLQAVSAYFRKHIPKTSATKQIEILNNQIETLDNQLKAASMELEAAEKRKVHLKTQISDIDEALRNSAAAKAHQESRDRLASQLRRAEAKKNEFSEEIFRWIGENGRFLVSTKITEETFNYLDEKEHKGTLPSPYNEEFVKGLLEDEECICGAPLKVGSDEAKKVASLMNRAANQVMRERITKVRARLTNLKSGRKRAPDLLRTAKKRQADASEEFDTLEQQLAEVSKKIKGINLSEITEKEARREQLESELSQLERDIGVAIKQIENTKKDRAEQERQIDALAKRDRVTAVFSQRRNKCESLKGQLETRLNQEEESARSVIRASMRRILDATTTKALQLKMMSDYEIRLVDRNGTTLPKSSGENQLLGLAFTAALIDFAKIRKGAKDDNLLPGTIAPLVLDSPFGQLSETYRSATAQFIPKMARQVIILVSKSQGSAAVTENLAEHLGAEYLLVRHNSEQRGDRRPEVRTLHGKDYATALFEADFDGTKIVEITPP